MTIDLNSKDGRKKFISEYLNDLLSGINDSYGPILLGELQKRLEYTINEFNDEINEAFTMLKKRDKDRKAFFKETIEEVSSTTKNTDDKTLWEQKLQELENNK